MFNIELARNLSENKDKETIESFIDEKIESRASQGYYFTTIIIYIKRIDLLNTYKEVLLKYNKYIIHYGTNHDNDYLIKISWPKLEEENICTKN